MAKAAGVTISTVSRTFSRPEMIGDKTRNRVLAAAADLSYRPNALAGSLTTKKTLLMGLVTADIRNPSVASLARGVQDSAYDRRYLCIICSTAAHADSGVSMLEEMVWRGVDGIILTSSYGMLDDRMRDFIENQPEPRLPLVYVGRHRSLPSVDFVTPQGFQGGAIAVTHLIENGHRDIACLSGDYTRDVALRRWDAYIATLKTYDIPFNPDRVAMDETTLEGGYTAMTKVLATGTGPTAVFAVNDLMALGAIEAIRDAGLSVPDDISVVGFDDIPTAALSTPRLSTVAQPSYDVGVASVEMLLRRIDDPEMEQQIKLMDCRLVPRETVRRIGTG